jgi:threonyl-tRNA synthetase
MTFIGEDGKERRPYMVHRALMGSLERFFGVLVEHYGGAFPVWLAPVQVMIIPIADRHLEYAGKLEAELKADGLRVQVDARPERMNSKIREAQLQKIPYMLVVGDKEMAAEGVSIRLRSGEDMGKKSVAEFKSMAKDAVSNKTA